MAFRSLKELVFEYLGKDMNKELQTSDFGEAELSPAQYDYAAKDSYTLLPLHSVLEQRIQELELTEVMEVENEAALALAETAFRGVKITEEAWNAVASDLALEKVKFEATLHQMAVDDKASYIPDNWGSPDQKKLFLSELMGWSLTSVAEPILKELEDKDPIIPVMMAHQKVKTGLERYGPNWLGKISRVTERVHPDWHPIGAVTGRQSCSNPPMQQIKRGSLYRKLFVAEENNMVARCDLPAIEARIMAEYSEDEKMINIFLEGRDIHIETAAMVNGKDPQDINKDSIERQIAKTIRYLKGFGGGWWRLQQECKKMGINLNERAAREINAKFDREFPDFYKWQKAQGATAMSVSRLGRKRYLPDPPPGMNIRTAKGNKYSPYTQRLNSPVQGTGADIIKLCLIELMRTRTSELAGWGPIVVSHDEIAVERPKAAKDAAVEWLRNAMLVGANKILKRVPLKAHELEVKIGANYTCE
jgi:DNA polymerase I